MSLTMGFFLLAVENEVHCVPCELRFSQLKVNMSSYMYTVKHLSLLALSLISFSFLKVCGNDGC